MWKISRAARLIAAAFFVVALVGVALVLTEPSASVIAGHVSDSFLAIPTAVAALGANLKALRERRAKLVASMTEMVQLAETENRDFTEEEQAKFDALKQERAGLDTRIDRLGDQEAAETALDAVVPARSRNAGPQPQDQHYRRPNEASTSFENFGEFVAAVRFRPNDQRLHFVEGVGASHDENGMPLNAELRMDNDTQGGFMVPTQFRDGLMQVEPQEALVRPRAQVIPAGSPPDSSITIGALDQSGANPGNMYGGVEVRWIAEGQSKPETNANLSEITLTPQEVAGFMTITDKLLRNWPAADAFVRSQFRAAVAGAEDWAFTRGTGVGQPLGALNAGATKYINRAGANTIGYLDLLGMVSVLLMRGGEPVWSMPQGALPKIATLQDPEGHYIWKANAVDGFAGTLMGYPLRWNNRMPLLGSKGDVLLGDWKSYLIKDGSGPFIAASEHVKFLENKTVIKVFWNVDGAPWMKGPIKEENGYEVSSFVGLDVPA